MVHGGDPRQGNALFDRSKRIYNHLGDVMQFMGGKAQTGKRIAEVIAQHRTNQLFIEPFVGACNVTIHVFDGKIACDSNKYLITMWEGLQKGWEPPDAITKEQYALIKRDKPIDPITA